MTAPDRLEHVALEAAMVRRGPAILLGPITWTVTAGQRWVILGPNGSGKSTLLAVAALRTHPSSGAVRILDQSLGSCDVRAVRERIGYDADGLAQQIQPSLSLHDVVLTGWHAALAPWWHDYDDRTHAAADAARRRVGLDLDPNRSFGTLSSGERQLALLARALIRDPELILLDEPAAGLDPGGRESLLAALDALAEGPDRPPLVMVTHHVEEIPTSTTHALLLREGLATAAGPVDEVVTGPNLTDCFGTELTAGRDPGPGGGPGRWWCRSGRRR